MEPRPRARASSRTIRPTSPRGTASSTTRPTCAAPGAPNTGNGYFGGLQFDIGFQLTYGGWLYRAKGTAEHWTPLEQMWTAERAHAPAAASRPGRTRRGRAGLLSTRRRRTSSRGEPGSRNEGSPAPDRHDGETTPACHRSSRPRPHARSSSSTAPRRRLGSAASGCSSCFWLGHRGRRCGRRFDRDRHRGDDRRAADAPIHGTCWRSFSRTAQLHPIDADPHRRCGRGGRVGFLVGHLAITPIVAATNSQVAQRVHPATHRPARRARDRRCRCRSPSSARTSRTRCRASRSRSRSCRRSPSSG